MRATRLAFHAVLLSAVFVDGARLCRARRCRRIAPSTTSSLNKASDRSGITGISGRMVYEFNGSACEGYTVKFRFVTQIVTNDNTRLTDQQTTTFEDAEGKTFSFVTKSFVDQNLDKEVKGIATKDAKGLKVDIDKPEKNSLELAATQFPTQHLVELIGKAEKGENFYETNLFDGSEDANKVMTTTVDRRQEDRGRQGRSGSCRRWRSSPPTNTGRSTSPISTTAPRRRRGSAGVPDQLQAARERHHPRSRSWTMATSR